MELLSVQNLSIDIRTEYNTLHALRDVSFTVRRGQTTCLVGESGCGKSLTALCLMGLLARQARMRAGSLLFDGQPLLDTRGRQRRGIQGRRVAMVFQEPMTSLNPTLTIGTQMCEGLIHHKGVSVQGATQRAVHLLDRVGVTQAPQRLRQYPHELSGGLRQRVMIATALMCEPELLIADEPTTALDVTIQAQIIALLDELRRELGIAVLLVTHDLGLVSHIADQVLVMYAGEIVESGTVGDVLRGPRHPYTRGLLACIPDFHRGAAGRRLDVIAGQLPDLSRLAPGCSFRPRCQRATTACEQGHIEFRHVGSGHAARCRHPIVEEIVP